MGREIFPQLLGNEKIKGNLAMDAANNKSAHAYIIEGLPGSGKHLLARLICAASVCQHRESDLYPLPCGECPTCRRILRDISPDVTYISLNGKASIGVDAIRTMKETLYITPNDSDKKFYIIEDAELMTAQAQNSLLLSLEEPPEYVMILLLTTHAAGLLETIRSRAPVIRMEVFSPKEVREYLTAGDFIHPAEYSESKLTEAAYLSNGAIGQAAAYLQSDGETENRRALAARLADGLVGKTRVSELLAFVSDSLSIEREAVLEVLALTQTALRDMIAVKKTDEGLLLFYFSENDMPEDARRVSVRKLIYLYDMIHNAYENISMNGSIQTVLTELVLKKDKNK